LGFLTLKMGPIGCPETSVGFLFGLIDLEDGTDTLSRNIGRLSAWTS
jgi:hypothetical protein